MAAGTVTATTTVVERFVTGVLPTLPNGNRPIVKNSIAWVSNASGDVSGNSVTMPAGSIVMVEFVPDSGGTQPTNLYDVSLTDDHDVNVFDDGAGASIGANLSNTAATHKVPFIGGGSVTYVRAWLHGGSYTPLVTNAGNAKGGTIHVYQCLDVI